MLQEIQAPSSTDIVTTRHPLSRTDSESHPLPPLPGLLLGLEGVLQGSQACGKPCQTRPCVRLGHGACRLDLGPALRGESNRRKRITLSIDLPCLWRLLVRGVRREEVVLSPRPIVRIIGTPDNAIRDFAITLDELLLLACGAKHPRHQLSGTGAESVGHIVAFHVHVLSSAVLAAQHNVGMRMWCIGVMGHRPVEGPSEVTFHLRHEELRQLRLIHELILRRTEDQAELMPVVLRRLHELGLVHDPGTKERGILLLWPFLVGQV